MIESLFSFLRGAFSFGRWSNSPPSPSPPCRIDIVRFGALYFTISGYGIGPFVRFFPPFFSQGAPRIARAVVTKQVFFFSLCAKQTPSFSSKNHSRPRSGRTNIRTIRSFRLCASPGTNPPFPFRPEQCHLRSLRERMTQKIIPSFCRFQAFEGCLFLPSKWQGNLLGFHAGLLPSRGLCYLSSSLLGLKGKWMCPSFLFPEQSFPAISF